MVISAQQSIFKRPMVVLLLINAILAITLKVFPNSHAKQFYGGEFSPINWEWIQDYIPVAATWGAPGLNWEAQSVLGADGTIINASAAGYSFLAYFQYITNIDYLAQTSLILCSSVFLGTINCYCFLRSLFASKMALITGSLAYGWNTYFVVSISGGQYSESVPAAFIPLIFLGGVRFVEATRSRGLYLYAASAVAVSAIHPVLAFMSIVSCGTWLVVAFCDSRIKIRRIIIYIIICIIASVWVSSPWLVTAFQGNVVEAFPAGYTSLGMVKEISRSSYHYADALASVHPAWPSQLYWSGNTGALSNVIVCSNILILVLVILISKSERMITGSILIHMICSFIAKGLNDPLPEINEWIFINIPGFFAFRSMSKFAIISSLMFAIVCCRFVIWIEADKKILRRSVAIGITLWLTSVVNVAVLADGSHERRIGGAAPQSIPSGIVEFENILKQDNQDVRVLVVPWGGAGLERSNSRQYTGLYHLLGSFGASLPHYGSFGEIYRSLWTFRNIEELLWLNNISYIIVPFDSDGVIFGRDGSGNGYEAPSRADFVKFISMNPVFEPVVESKEIYVWRVAMRGKIVETFNGIREVEAGWIDRDVIGSTIANEDLSRRNLQSKNIGVRYIDRKDSGCHPLVIRRTRILCDFSLAGESWVVLRERYSESWDLRVLSNSVSEKFALGGRRTLGLLDYMIGLNKIRSHMRESELVNNHLKLVDGNQAWLLAPASQAMLYFEYSKQNMYDFVFILQIISGAVTGIILIFQKVMYQHKNNL